VFGPLKTQSRSGSEKIWESRSLLGTKRKARRVRVSFKLEKEINQTHSEVPAFVFCDSKVSPPEKAGFHPGKMASSLESTIVWNCDDGARKPPPP